MNKCLLSNCTNLPASGAGRTGKYCSLSCSTKHRNILSAQKKITEYNLTPAKCYECNSPLCYDKRKNTFCSTSCSAKCTNRKRSSNGWTHSETTKQKMSELAKLNPRGCIVNHVPHKKTGKHILCNHCSTEFYVSPKSKKKYCSPICGNKHRGGFRSSSQLSPNQSTYCGYKMDSGAERYFAELLNSRGIAWIKNDHLWKKRFPYKKENGKWYFYYPDFYIPHLNMWVEIKGKRYIRSDDSERYRCVQNHYLVMSTDILSFVTRMFGA